MQASVAAHGAHGVDDERKVRLGMLFYVLTDVTFVVFLLASYVWLRGYNTASGWFPYPNMALPNETTTTILTGLIVASAVCFYVAARASRSNNQALMRGGMLLALALLAVTFVWQIRFMGQQQFGPLDGSFASSYILLSGYHIYHMALGLFLGIGLTVRAFRGRYSAEHRLGFVTIGYFWYWMALTPVLVQAMMIALPARI